MSFLSFWLQEDRFRKESQSSTEKKYVRKAVCSYEKTRLKLMRRKGLSTKKNSLKNLLKSPFPSGPKSWAKNKKKPMLTLRITKKFEWIAKEASNYLKEKYHSRIKCLFQTFKTMKHINKAMNYFSKMKYLLKKTKKLWFNLS